MLQEWLYFLVLLVPIVPGLIVLGLEADRTGKDQTKGEGKR